MPISHGAARKRRVRLQIQHAVRGAFSLFGTNRDPIRSRHFVLNFSLQGWPEENDLIGDILEADFGPTSKSAIKSRIRCALTQAEATTAIATSLHR